MNEDQMRLARELQAGFKASGTFRGEAGGRGAAKAGGGGRKASGGSRFQPIPVGPRAQFAPAGPPRVQPHARLPPKPEARLPPKPEARLPPKPEARPLPKPEARPPPQPVRGHGKDMSDVPKAAENDRPVLSAVDQGANTTGGSRSKGRTTKRRAQKSLMQSPEQKGEPTTTQGAPDGPIIWHYQDQNALPEFIGAPKATPALNVVPAPKAAPAPKATPVPKATLPPKADLPPRPPTPMAIDTPPRRASIRAPSNGYEPSKFSLPPPPAPASQPVSDLMDDSPPPLLDPMQLDIPDVDKEALARMGTLQPVPVWNPGQRAASGPTTFAPGSQLPFPNPNGLPKWA